ncbi:MAG: XRE family transcriptional regulator [SAR86 cluster bacterium]|uniref:XRE family transcriptional regulator n=1 Tax=SAR86 cluster bacterium TaxID=2030880 RepID=A0A2A5AU26_9GAMM|nr:MAG: XRE family transcriptional regulator [SAR86 cluster bacterium]
MTKKLSIEDMVKAIEADAGQAIPGLAESIAESRTGAGITHSPDQIMLKAARKITEMSQPKFADWLETPVGTLRDWEQGRSEVPGAVKKLLQITISHPEIVAEYS